MDIRKASIVGDEAHIFPRKAGSAMAIPSAEQLEPFTPERETLTESHVVGFDTRDIKSRPFNLLRSQVVKKLKAKNWKVVGITSATPAAGKSFLSANLAAALSRLPDKKVYLFDFDLRRASLAQVFGLQAESGLAEFLSEENTSLQAVGRRVGEASFALFPCYATYASSAEVLVGPRFDALMQALHELPDDAVVICDLPPVFANDDAMMIAQKLDAYMLVVEQGVTTKKQIKDTMRLLDPTPCLGTVFNRYEGGFGDPYGYGYGGKYEKYYSS